MSTIGSLRIIMAIVVHFDLEFHHMDVRTTFLNRDLVEDVYISEPLGFEEVGTEHMVCKLQKSIYGLKKASRRISSLMKLSPPMVLRRTSSINAYI